MTASELRQTMGLQTHEEELQSWIEKIEDNILIASRNNSRFYVSKMHPTPLGTEIAQHFLNNGFYVTHYVSPYDHIEIRW